MIAISADNLPVTCDSKAFSGLGQNIQMAGLAFTDLISVLRTASVVQKSRRPVAGKTILLLMAAFSLILTTTPCQAGLGWTLAEFEQEYGKPVLDHEQIAGRLGYVFTGKEYIIAAFFRNTQVSRILYICRAGFVFDWARARSLLMADVPGSVWDDASKNEADNSYRVNGTKNSVESYYASLTDDGQMLAIWTKQDDEAGRIKPKFDPPSVSSVVGSNEKSSDEVTAESVPSIDNQSTPEKTYPDVSANATPSSSAQRPASAFRTKIARVKLRSSLSRRKISHEAKVDAKARSTALSRQHVETQLPAPTPFVMNAGTQLYNSDYTQPFKNLKKASGP